jgi:hypothetical protein
MPQVLHAPHAALSTLFGDVLSSSFFRCKTVRVIFSKQVQSSPTCNLCLIGWIMSPGDVIIEFLLSTSSSSLQIH